MTENMGKQIRTGRQRSALTQERLAETWERSIAILREDWPLGECGTVRGCRQNLAACR